MATQQISRETLAQTPQFLVSASPGSGSAIELGDFLAIGRDDSNGLTIQDPFASGRHARIERKDHGYLLRDLRSRNGTFVNGTRVYECILSENDRINFGETEFIFKSTAQATISPSQVQSKNIRWNDQLAQIPAFAKTNFPVLILGESGTGKEVIARSVHEFSQRSGGPFISVNCSALSEALVESELFGHMRGSFTGATHDRKGAFETARGGTLFLDEIGDLPLKLQPKLLRALENAEIRPVGSDRTIHTDVRIVAATHQDLREAVRSGEFRNDLYFRLNVIRIEAPRLRERMEDFMDLVYEFARQMRVRFSHNALLMLKDHTWPGNVRELRNVVARAAACFPGAHIQEQHIRALIDNPIQESVEHQTGLITQAGETSPIPVIKEIEREIIRSRLIANQGNQRRTASELGLPKSTLHDRIKAYKIDLAKLLNG